MISSVHMAWLSSMSIWCLTVLFLVFRLHGLGRVKGGLGPLTLPWKQSFWTITKFVRMRFNLEYVISFCQASNQRIYLVNMLTATQKIVIVFSCNFCVFWRSICWFISWSWLCRSFPCPTTSKWNNPTKKDIVELFVVKRRTFVEISIVYVYKMVFLVI